MPDICYYFPPFVWVYEQFEVKWFENNQLVNTEVKKAISEYYKEQEFFKATEFQILKEKIIEKKIEPKKLKGSIVNGRMFCSLVHSFLEVFYI